MKLGIKVGLQKQSLQDLEQTKAPFAEVWFDVNQADNYTELFNELKRRRMDVGLHFWGVLMNNTMVSFGNPDEIVLKSSTDLVRETIDIAAKWGFQYINIHPGSRSIVQMDLEHMDYPFISEPVPLDLANKTFVKATLELNSYAKSKNVLLTVETVPRTVPKKDWYGSTSRLKPFDLFQLPVSSIKIAADNGLAVANDLGHTASDIISENPVEIWNYLYKTTQELALSTRLVHLGFLVPPFNGTDVHDSLDNPLLETDQAVPNRKQMIELLKLFRNRDDVWALVEPQEDHVKNYFSAKKIFQEAGVLFS